MGVLVKGMKMPENCAKCICADDNARFCTVVHEYIPMLGKPAFCPLVELPEKHGDLIDRQKLIEDNKHLEYPTDGKYRRDRAWAVGFNAGARHCNEHAVYAKTVIEAEGE